MNNQVDECKNFSIEMDEMKINKWQIIGLFMLLFILGLILLALICKKIARRKYLKDLNEAVSKYVSEYSRIEESKLSNKN